MATLAATAAAPVDRSIGRRRHVLGPFVLLLGPLGWLAFFYLAPLCILLVHALWSVNPDLTINHSLTLANVRKFFSTALYPRVLWRTVQMALLVTVTTIAIAFPISFYLAKRLTRNKDLLLLLVIFPLWSSYLVRVFAWKTILGTSGILNSFLLWTGVISEPASFLLYSKTAMFITFCHVWLPFMILPLYTILERIPDSLLEAAADLGSSGPRTFLRIVLPLSLPGILAGSLSVFSLTMGDYITPMLIGGPGDQLIGRIVADNFGMANNWPLGATLIVPVLLIVSAILVGANRFGALGRSTP
jgi:ABC-type spermidine/putrescine transport system permease subunit I